MSILNNTPDTPEEIASARAEAILNGTVRGAKRLVRDWEKNIDLLWDHPDPQAILDSLGTDAAEVFELSTAIIQLMATILPERNPALWASVQQRLAKIKPCTINENGTVTMN